MLLILFEASKTQTLLWTFHVCHLNTYHRWRNMLSFTLAPKCADTKSGNLKTDLRDSCTNNCVSDWSEACGVVAHDRRVCI